MNGSSHALAPSQQCNIKRLADLLQMTGFLLAVNCHAESVSTEMNNASLVAIKGAKCIFKKKKKNFSH